MNDDLYEHASLGDAISGFNRWRRDAMPSLGAVLDAEPELAMANIAKALILLGGRDVRFFPAVDDCISKATEQAGTLRDYETQYLDALTLMRSNHYQEAIDVFEKILDQRPTDFFAHRVLQQELFWSGGVVKMRDIASKALPHWSGEEHDYGNFLGLLAFGHEETGNYAEAERLGREAIERDSSDAWAAHAVAHVLEMQGRTEDGIQWIEPLTGNWGEVNQIAHHVWWHLCLFYLERDENEKILRLLKEQVHNPDSPLVQAMPDLYIDVQNVASLLFRLHMRGVNVSAEYENYVDAARSRIDNHQSPFTSAHAAIILCGADRFDDCRELIDSMKRYAASESDDLASRLTIAAIPAAEATRSWFSRDFDAVVEQLTPALGELHVMGGSHAQRDIFTQMLYHACVQTDRPDQVSQLLSAREQVGYSTSRNSSFWN